jgi:hypothetical protein
MANSSGVVDQNFPTFSHEEIDITREDNSLPFLVNLNHSKAARLGAARVQPLCSYQAPDPKLASTPSQMQKEWCARDVLRLRHARQRTETPYLVTKCWWHIAVAKQQIEKP